MVLKQIQYFLTVVDKMSFTEAAEALYISQSAVSQQITALEAELGVSLLKREKRSFSVTPAGEFFYRRCKALLRQMDAIVSETVRIGTDDESRLRIGCLNLYRGYALREAVIAFSKLYPHVELSIVSGNHEELYRKVVSGEVDLVLNDQRRAFSDEFANEIIADAGFWVDLPEDFPLEHPDYVEIAELDSLPCLLLSSQGGHSTDESYFRENVGFSGSFSPMENFENASMLVASGRGYLPFYGIGTVPPPPKGVRCVPLYRSGKPIRTHFCAFWLQNRGGYYVEEFTAMLKQRIDM